MYDIYLSLARVEEILSEGEEKTTVIVQLEEEDTVARAINYNYLAGEISIGDRVLLNTTAVRLGLGTGGYHFVVANLTKNKFSSDNHLKDGHIMKMRYSPLQVRTLSVEEEVSPHHENISKFCGLKGHPIVLIPLHSLLAPVVIAFKLLYPKYKTVYIMTEGGSLPLGLSRQVQLLKEKGYLDGTVTIGQAFGGDLEAVNIITGLAAARDILKGELIVAGMGPGIVGTNTRFGFSGVENAFINYAVNIIGGKSIIVPRISLAEKRKRHHGLSHHTKTLLESLIDRPVDVVMPEVESILNEVNRLKLSKKHRIFYYNPAQMETLLEECGFPFKSMGRSFEDDPLFFITSALAIKRWQEIFN